MIFSSASKWILFWRLYFTCDVLIATQCAANFLKESEEVKVIFVTRLRHGRDIRRNDFHILQVHRASMNSSFQIHIVKNDHLLAPNLKVIHHDNTSNSAISDDRTMKNEENCLYSGVIASSDSTQGQVALSACGEEPGFHGVIMTDSGMHVLEPKKEGIGSQADQEGLEITHTLVAVSDDGQTGGWKCGKHDIYAPRPKPSLEDFSENYGPVPLSLNHGINLRGKQLKRKHISGRTKSSKTSTKTDERIVELAVYGDESFMERIKKKLNTTSTNTIQAFVFVLVEAMALLYQHPSMETKIAFKIVYAEFFSRNPSSLNSHHGLVEPFLASFCKYVVRHSEPGDSDHAMLLTAIDLREEDSNSVVGVAYKRGCCRDGSHCSVIEGTSLKAAYVMAHEMGHSLGMEHDGRRDNIACDSGDCIMSPRGGPEQNKWSSCSNRNIKDFLKSNENSRSSKVRKDCLRSLTATSGNSYDFMSSRLPGERFSPDEQCQFTDIKRPIAVTRDMRRRFKLKGNMCEELYCTDSAKSKARFSHPALEGTACGTGKQCRGGACVKMS